MEKARRKSSCLLTDKSNAWKYLTGVKLSTLQPNVIAEDFYEAPETTEKEESKGVYCIVRPRKKETHKSS